MTSVIVGVNENMLNIMPWRNGRLTFFKLLIHIFHFTLVLLIFYPQNLNLLFIILNEVFRIFIRIMFWFQQIRQQTWLYIILILLNVSLLTLMPINCRLLWVRKLLSMGMVVIQPCTLMPKVSKLKKTATMSLRCTVYLNPIKIYKARCIANSRSCTATELSKIDNHMSYRRQKHVIKYCQKVYERSVKNLF